MARVSGKRAETELLTGLGRAIRELRSSRGLSQEALADEAGIDRSHMGKIERGERNVTVLNVERIATALEVQPSALFVSAGF